MSAILSISYNSNPPIVKRKLSSSHSIDEVESKCSELFINNTLSPQLRPLSLSKTSFKSSREAISKIEKNIVAINKDIEIFNISIESIIEKNQLCCPITANFVERDKACLYGAKGYEAIYDKESIIQWIENNKTNPLTMLKLQPDEKGQWSKELFYQTQVYPLNASYNAIYDELENTKNKLEEMKTSVEKLTNFLKEKNQEKDKYFQLIDSKGDGESQYEIFLYFMDLAKSLSYKDKVKKAKKNGFEWCLKAIKNNFSPALASMRSYAEEGHAIAQFYLALSFRNEWCKLKYDNSQYTHWLSSAAKQGHADAQNLLTRGERAFKLGLKYEKSGNLKKALELFMEATTYDYIKAKFYLGEHFLLKNNFDEAVKWLTEALKHHVVDNDIEDASAKAQIDLGICYYMQKKYTKAVEFLTEGLKKGRIPKSDYIRGQFTLGMCFTEASTDNYNYSKGLDLIKVSAAEGYAKAKYYLGKFYIKGLYGLTKNRVEGLKLVKEAAYQKPGFQDALVMLGLHYHTGQDEIVKVNKIKAIKLLEMAAACGNSGAVGCLKTIREGGLINKFDW